MTDSKPTDYVSIPLIKIEGAEPKLLDEFKRDILQICVEESLHLPGMFTLVVNNPYLPVNQEDETWKYDPILQIGKVIEIGFKSSSTESTPSHEAYLIKGEITGLETHFTSSTQAPIVIRGYDAAHRLHRGRYIRSFIDITDSDIVKKIAEESGIEIGNIAPSGDKHKYVFQENQTNMEFLRERAARIGFELFVQAGKINFRNPKAGEVLELKWLRDVSSFRVRVTAAEQVKSVEVRSWDCEKKEPIIARIPKENQPSVSHNSNSAGQAGLTAKNQPMTQRITNTEYGEGSDYSQKFGANSPEPKMLVVDKPTATAKEAEVMAQALFDELEGEFIHADAQAPGDPRIRPGKVIELKGMGRYSGKYYVTETRHLFYQGIYTTEFSVRGLRSGSLLRTLSPTARLRPGQTHLVGIVTDNKDPLGLGRVKVKFPTLTPEKDSTAHTSCWARMVSIGAGKDRGFDCLPEINDEVLVAFEHGDIHRPYIIGSVWNGKDKPPAEIGDAIADSGPDFGKVRLRTFKTRTGHVLQFVESKKDASHAGIHIKTSKGHSIRLDDSNGAIAITTQGGQSVRLDSGGISIESTGNINLKPGLGKVVISGTILTAGVSLSGGVGTSTPVDVGEKLTNLEKQLQQNKEANQSQNKPQSNSPNSNSPPNSSLGNQNPIPSNKEANQSQNKPQSNSPNSNSPPNSSLSPQNPIQSKPG